MDACLIFACQSDGSTKDDARISPEMENEVSVAFNTYTELLNAVDGDRALERKVERDLGKQVLLLKQMLHIGRGPLLFALDVEIGNPQILYR